MLPLVISWRHAPAVAPVVWPPLQWNIERGYKLADIINTLREVDADVLALQVCARELRGSWGKRRWSCWKLGGRRECVPLGACTGAAKRRIAG